MDDTVLKIALAGFLHDIGKVSDEGALNVSDEFINNNAGLYQPFHNGYYSHKHAVYTAAFIDHIEKLLPRKLNQANWGLDDSFINLTAGHHNPQTPMQWIIAMADRIGSGWDRATFDSEYNHAVAWQDYRKTRLLPILEKLTPDDHGNAESADVFAYRYPLKEMSPENIFPNLKELVCPNDNDQAKDEYKKLFDGFVYALERLLHREENLDLWFEHLDSLLMIYTTAIPAARAGKVVPDVSLYDHSRMTAALATALYLYHRDEGEMSIESIRDEMPKKLLLISGDFFGIQNFIFSDSGEAGKNRTKILRGRSFAVSLFSELLADMLCREIGIPSSSVVLNAAGKFTIIAPNTESARRAVTDVEDRANGWLMQIAYGESAIGMVCQDASAADMVHGGFADVWDRLNRNMERKKLRKFDLTKVGGTVEGYLDGFRNDLVHPLCPFCGKRPSSPDVEGSRFVGEAGSACRICRDHIFLGTNLVKRDRLAVMTTDAEIKGDEKLMEPVFGTYQVAFLGGGLNEMARRGQLLKYWDISINTEGTAAKDVTAKFINGYVPVYREEDCYDDRILEGERSDESKADLIESIREETPKTFTHIASKSRILRENGKGYRGIEALGILKADVDDLGMLMSCGLKGKQFTISRLATLSRQVNAFFTLYLPHLLKTDQRFLDVYTVFAGGDDLFLIGPWNRIVELAGYLSETFADYVCHNGTVHFSAGITIQKPNIPLDRVAEETKKALSQSKRGEKNQITLFAETATWEEFRALREVRNAIQGWRVKDWINSAMIYRLNAFIGMAAEEKRLLTKRENEIDVEDMECLKWHSLFGYSIARNVGKGLKEGEKDAAMREVTKAATWLDQYGGRLRIALWDVIYNNR